MIIWLVDKIDRAPTINRNAALHIVVQNVSRLLVCGMIRIAGMVTGIVEWWNGGMYSMVGRRNDTMRLRMRTGMNSGMDEILVASLDLDVCIYNLYVDAEENRQARQNEQTQFYLRIDS